MPIERGAANTMLGFGLRDLLIDDNGNYTRKYYDVKKELELTDEETNILMESNEVDQTLKVILQSIVDYKIDKKKEAKLTDNELYTLISDTILDINNISDETKSRIINKASVYRNDISKFIYDIDVRYLQDLT